MELNEERLLLAIGRMMDEKLARQTAEIKEYIANNNAAIGEVMTAALERTEAKIKFVK